MNGVQAEEEQEQEHEQAPDMVSSGLALRVGPLLFVAVGVGAAVASLGLGIGSVGRPGPGFWPLVVGTLTAVLSLVMIIRPDAVEVLKREEILRVGTFVAGLVVYLLVFDVLGFLISSVLLLAYLLIVISRTKWWQAALVSIFGGFFTWFVFASLLGVRLPEFAGF